MNINNTISGVFTNYVRRFPDHLAVIDGKHRMTYAELDILSSQLAHYLIQHGVKSETPVAICIPRSSAYLITIIAVLKSGGTYLPIDIQQPKDRLSYVLKDSLCEHLISLSPYENQFQDYNKKLIVFDKIQTQLKSLPVTVPTLDWNPNQLAYIIYTSGSTGAPKGVQIEHKSVINYSQWFAKYTRSEAQQHVDFSSNPIFDMAISVTLVSLMLGMTIVICDDETKKDTSAYLHFLSKNKINLIKVTPSYFKVLFQEVKNQFFALPYLNSIILGGENLTTTDCKNWLDLYPKHFLFNEYGPTEATVAVSVFEVNQRNVKTLDINVPIGEVGENMSVLVVNEQLKSAPTNKPGELLIHGVCLARGYLNQPDLTAKKFIFLNTPSGSVERFYRTGDLCSIDANQRIHYLGRIDDQVKIRGYRIEPAEVEQVLCSYSKIQSAAVVAQKNGSDELCLAAYYIVKNPTDSSVEIKELKNFLLQSLPDYMIPTAFIKVPLLPLTSNGKLDKTALPIPKIESSTQYHKPITDLEKKLAQLWSTELGVPSVGLYDNFFELGGHSLSAARLVVLMNHSLKKKISIHEFYKARCIAELIPLIENAANHEKIEHEENFFETLSIAPLSDFQFVLWMADTFEPKAKKLNIVSRKRLQGKIDSEVLQLALDYAVKKHEALRFNVAVIQPIQQIGYSTTPIFEEENIKGISLSEQQKILDKSFEDLSSMGWPKNYASIKLKLFYLNNQSSEIQIAVPHLISDDASMDIIISDISDYYLLLKNNSTLDIPSADHFKRYTFEEREIIQNNTEQGTHFWEKYLLETSYFSFPQKYIVSDMKSRGYGYSTYYEISQEILTKIKKFCLHNHLSITHGLASVLALAIRNCSDNEQEDSKYKVMNLVKSTRDDPSYDRSVGCFLRVEPVRIAINHESTLYSLSKQIHQSAIDTSNYQDCSNLIKFAAVSNLRLKKFSLKNLLINCITPFLFFLFQIPKVYRKILRSNLARMMCFKRNRYFIVNLNIRENFLTSNNKSNDYFGYKQKTISGYKQELLAIDYIFEACFSYDENLKKHFLILSGNLHPGFRLRLAQEIVHIIDKFSIQSKPISNKTRTL